MYTEGLSIMENDIVVIMVGALFSNCDVRIRLFQGYLTNSHCSLEKKSFYYVFLSFFFVVTVYSN